MEDGDTIGSLPVTGGSPNGLPATDAWGPLPMMIATARSSEGAGASPPGANRFTLLNREGRYEPITWPSNAAGSVMFPTRSTFPGRTLHGLEVLLLLNKRLVARALVRQQ